jgi:hypothetical protein
MEKFEIYALSNIAKLGKDLKKKTATNKEPI